MKVARLKPMTGMKMDELERYDGTCPKLFKEF